MLGNPGDSTGVRRRASGNEEPADDGLGKGLPSGCIRKLSSIKAFRDCPVTCEGRQEDHSCLCDIVEKAQRQGVDWQFELDSRTGEWHYVGPELDD